MNFWANPLQPVAGATGVIPRVQLPVAGRVANALFGPGNGRPLPPIVPAALRDHPHPGVAMHRAQHRAQCRAACMSKANF